MKEPMIKLLIADDSSFSRNKVKKSVHEIDEDIQVFEASDGSEALNVLQENKIDILILDIVMPGMTGIELLETMRKDLSFRSTFVLMFTSMTDRSKLLECFELGALDYIQKPLEELEFKARMKAVLRNKMIERKSIHYLETLRRQNGELKNLNQALVETKAKMVHQEKLAGIGQLAAGVAHEINNPLGYLMSNFESLQTYLMKYKALLDAYDALDREIVTKEDHGDYKAFQQIQTLKGKEPYAFIREDIEEIVKDGIEGLGRIKCIVQGLRDFSRVDATQEFEPYSLNKGIEDTLKIMRNEFKGTTEICFEKGEIPLIDAVGGEINQVLLNLLMNANDAIKEKFSEIQMGKIEIETTFFESGIGVVIRDNGIGIPSKKLSQIFNPFFTTKSVGAGTGLGLSIAYDVIHAKHHGTIDVESKEGVGTTFQFTLPVKQNEGYSESDKDYKRPAMG